MNQFNTLGKAISFAARAHRHQLRKDGQTPYAAHPFRVCMVVRHIFGVEELDVLIAAVLHDTIEDTPTDYDDIAEPFGTEVANWVSQLTKEMRLPEAERESRYHAVLRQAPWPVVVCKLADIYDNLTDSEHLSPAKRARTVERSRDYLEVLRQNLTHPAAERAYEMTRSLLEAVN